MVDENLDFAIVVPENGVVLEIIEFPERHWNGSVAAFLQKGQNSVCEEDAAVSRSFSPNNERSKTRIRKCNGGCSEETGTRTIPGRVGGSNREAVEGLASLETAAAVESPVRKNRAYKTTF